MSEYSPLEKIRQVLGAYLKAGERYEADTIVLIGRSKTPIQCYCDNV